VLPQNSPLFRAQIRRVRYTEFEIDPEHFKKLMATFNVTLHPLLPLKVFFSLQPQAPMFVKLGQLQAKNQNEYVRCSLC